MKVKSILMLAFAVTAFLFASCEKDNHESQPQSLSEMIIGKWECTESNDSSYGPYSIPDIHVYFGGIWNFRDDGILVNYGAQGGKLGEYSIEDGEILQLRIGDYELFDMTLTNDKLTLYHRVDKYTGLDDFFHPKEHYGHIFDAKFTKIQ